MARDYCIVRGVQTISIPLLLLLLLLLSSDASALTATVHHRPWDATVVGIDIGNTNSCVAGYTDRRAETMFQLCIPSWVAFTANGTLLVGDDARNHAALDPGSSIFGFKHLLGKRAETMFQLCIPSWVAFTANGTLLVGDDARNHAALDPGSSIFGFKRLLGKRAETMFQLCIPSWVAFTANGTLLVGDDARNHAALDPGSSIFGFKRLLGKRAETMFQLCIPSWVAFTANGTLLVGDDARNHAALDPGSSIFGFKRLLGKRWNHFYYREVVQRVIDTMPYKLVGNNFNPHIQVKANGGGAAKELGAEQITAMVIRKLREAAEAYTGRDVRYAVFTVPQHYNQAPTESMRYAGQIAGVRDTSMLAEPIAAAVAYGLRQKLREEGTALVLHVGGGTAEASVLALVDGVFDFHSARHDPFLGGDDFDQRIVDHFVELIKQKHGKDIGNDDEARGKLRTACEQAKKALSTRRHAQLAIESLVDGFDFSETLTRAKFEELNHDLFLKVVALLDRVMVEGALEKKMIDEIVLIGGSTMIPKIQRLVRDYFGGKEVNARLKPDEVVTLGAALLTHPSEDQDG